MKYNLFIGRFQSPHLGHMELFDAFLKQGKPVLIAVRDVHNSNDILSSEEVKNLLETIYKDNPLVKVMIIPDIDSVNYGRAVGYDVNEIHLAVKTEAISATYIKNCIINDIDEWKEYVAPQIHEKLETYIKAKF